MTKNQKKVAAFASLALVTVLFSLYFTKLFYVVLLEKGWALPAPVATVCIAVWLIVSVGIIGNKRYFHEDVIGGSAVDAPDGRLRVDKAVLQNTFEQLVLAGIIYYALEYVAGVDAQVYLATLTFLFSIGRICFLMGYEGGAGSRAFGFGLTFYPTVLSYAYVVLRFFFL